MTGAAAGADRFFIIGAQRSGTTSLYTMLDAHPDIVMARPVRPEPKHFLRDDAASPEALDDYQARHFDGTDARWYGEKSTTYIERPDAADRIAAAFPEARVIVSLRDPIERAVSNHRFSVANGFEDRDLRSALLEERPPADDSDGSDVSTSPFDYLGRSHYERHLPTWIEGFGDRVLVLVFEELATETGREPLEEFLGLEPGSLDPFGMSNATASDSGDGSDQVGELRVELISEFAATVAWVESFLGRPVPDWHAQPAK